MRPLKHFRKDTLAVTFWRSFGKVEGGKKKGALIAECFLEVGISAVNAKWGGGERGVFCNFGK